MKQEFIDTHCHLYSDAFDADRDEMIQRAFDAGVGRLLLPNIDEKSIPGMYALEAKYPNRCYPMMGLHPCSVTADWKTQLSHLEKELDARKFCAIGEIGVDMYWDKTLRKEQMDAFAFQVEWTKKHKLPIVIHARESFPEIFEVLDEVNSPDLTGVFHCFSGTVEEMEKVRSYGGFLFGIGGVVTFKKSGLDAVVKEMKLSEIILETDAPYLSPSPFRGKRNESSYIPYIAEKISDIFETSRDKVAEVTTKNAEKLFNL